ncbi:hypothetical protein SPONL_443 [uncultured Candidatus Thioglobus sp.]|nr:hypothetical protein SPONL_443 [uncultured Candidatus Thioglobus sp.]
MNYWVKKYNFSEHIASKIDENIAEFYNMLSKIDVSKCVKDNHECEKIKADLKKI